jgi:glucuronate isomerase
MAFIHEDFLLQNEPARRLYHDYAENEPILDYHCHLSPRDIAEDRRFNNLFEIWLEGDHYKWRAMRTNGEKEEYCTGGVEPWEKFLAWARTVPFTLRNPLYHWTHLELKRYFGIEELLDARTAQSIWDRANALLAGSDLTARGILRRFRVSALCTTDDPTDDLAAHRKIAAARFETRVYPTFRPDKALNVHLPEVFNPWVARLGTASNMDISSLSRFLDALRERHACFHSMGARLSDHGLSFCFAEPCSEAEAASIFDRARAGRAASPEEQARYAAFLMLFLGRLDSEAGWTKQLHLGARRNASTRAHQRLGPDTGYDSIGDWPQAESLGRYLDLLDRENALPKMVVYNLNPADNYPFATMIGNFQDGSVPGKIQFGSGWWYLDQKEGMEWQINALSNVGLLSRFVGMLTDSRSFLSFPRHEYFRRILCNLIGGEADRGELPDDFDALSGLIRDVCFGNAKRHFGFDV